MRSNDLDCDGSLSFEEFIQAMPANVKSISEEEHRYADTLRIYLDDRLFEAKWGSHRRSWAQRDDTIIIRISTSTNTEILTCGEIRLFIKY